MPSKQALVDKGTTTRVRVSTGLQQGAGNCKRYYVGRHTDSGHAYQYISYFKFDDVTSTNAWWSDVGKIIRATLTLTVDDGLGVLGDTMPSGSPKVVLRRLADAFGEAHAHADFSTEDWTTAAPAPDRSRTIYPTRGAGEQVQIDVTDFIEDWAPSKVDRRDGGAGRNKANHGFGLFGTTDPKNNWAAFSEDEAALTAYRPLLTLEYEYGPTAPKKPGLTGIMSPSGAVAALTDFQADFVDDDTSDLLSNSHVQVYSAGSVKGGSGSTNDEITVTSHGYNIGDEVWFHSLSAGAGLSVDRPYWVKSIVSASKFTVTASKSGSTLGTKTNITSAYSSLSVGKAFYSKSLKASALEVTNARFAHVPEDIGDLARGATYYWRARVSDTDGSVSPWSDLVSFSITNTAPNAPTDLFPLDAYSTSTLAGLSFGGRFTDLDAGDTLLAYEVQLSAYASGDARWADDANILWNTGKVYVSPDVQVAGVYEVPYGGAGLSAGTYHWRTRVWDSKQGVSNWAYSSVVLSADFVQEPNDVDVAIPLRKRAPWRILIKDMFQSDGVTPTVGRGPGRTIAILEDAMNTGASLMYNSPGEAHWTLSADHPQISVIEPKRTHYSIEFRQGDGWREVFAGLVWNFDATDRDVVFYGIDYLALLDRVVDTRYDSGNPDKSYLSGGSKYSNQTIKTIVVNQLSTAKSKTNSPVGFIDVNPLAIADMNETLTVYSTYQPTLNFVTGLLESHRAGRAYNTRISVQKTATGYRWVVQDNPGVLRTGMRMRYGELVQGYRVKPFGDDWATRVDAIGRDKDGLKVRYTTQRSEIASVEETYGRFDMPTFIDGISDGNDLIRRARQAVASVSTVGRQVGIGLRSGVLQPRDGYDIMDRFQVDIDHGAVTTANYGHDGEWVAVGITWQALQRGDLNTTLTLVPKESGSAPSSDIISDRPVNTQREWQVGWTVPDASTVSAKYWLDQSTGIVYGRVEGALVASITGTA